VPSCWGDGLGKGNFPNLGDISYWDQGGDGGRVKKKNRVTGLSKCHMQELAKLTLGENPIRNLGGEGKFWILGEDEKRLMD